MPCGSRGWTQRADADRLPTGADRDAVSPGPPFPFPDERYSQWHERISRLTIGFCRGKTIRSIAFRLMLMRIRQSGRIPTRIRARPILLTIVRKRVLIPVENIDVRKRQENPDTWMRVYSADGSGQYNEDKTMRLIVWISSDDNSEYPYQHDAWYKVGTKIPLEVWE
jgi:hypothetical protein